MFCQFPILPLNWDWTNIQWESTINLSQTFLVNYEFCWFFKCVAFNYSVCLRSTVIPTIPRVIIRCGGREKGGRTGKCRDFCGEKAARLARLAAPWRGGHIDTAQGQRHSAAHSPLRTKNIVRSRNEMVNKIMTRVIRLLGNILQLSKRAPAALFQLLITCDNYEKCPISRIDNLYLLYELFNCF